MILEIVNMRLSGDAFSDEEIRIRLEAKEKESQRENPRVEIAGGVGLTSLSGPVFAKANLLTQLSGATSLETFSTDLRDMAENDDVKQIVIDFDTPGGSSDMVEETGDLIKEISADKPIYGVANTEAGSAGLWLLSQTTKAYSTPSGRVGSLGAFYAHEDVSKLDEKIGRKITYISAGKYKTAGNPHEPLTAEAKGVIQESIDELYDDFRGKVAEGRGKSVEEVEATFGQGKMLSARKAAQVGMIDGVVSMKDFLDQLVTQNMSSGATSASGSLSRSVRRMKILQGGSLLSSSTAEHAGLEHSEPGEGVVVENPEINPDDSAGSRHVTKPEDNDVDDTTSNQQELDVQLRELLDLGDDGDIVASITELKAQAAPLLEVDKAVEAQRSFAQAFPEKAAELERLSKKDQLSESKKFADKYAGSRIKDDDGKETDRGFNALALERVQATHLRFAQGIGGISDVEGILDAIVDGGMVSYEEKGSSRGTTRTDVPEGETPRIQFANLVKQIRENDSVEQDVAIRMAAEQNPDLYAAYRAPVRA